MRFIFQGILILFVFVSSICVAAGDGIPVMLENVKIDAHDAASVSRGAKFFAQHCMVCHAMRFLKHNAVAKANGVLYEKMPLKHQEWWFGVAPPDLSLIGRVRSSDWLYTYLHSFYRDSDRQLGSNNLVMHNSSMPNPFGGLQGEQVLSVDIKNAHLLTGKYTLKPRYYTLLRLEKPGSMKPEEFHATIRDVVAFLEYASDPGQLKRVRLGWWVLGFLFIFGVLVYFLMRDYWREIS